MGTTAAPATLNIGWNESTDSSPSHPYPNHSTATGLLDATNGSLTAELSELRVGMTAGRGTADGTLIMGNGTAITTPTALLAALTEEWRGINASLDRML